MKFRIKDTATEIFCGQVKILLKVYIKNGENRHGNE